MVDVFRRRDELPSVLADVLALSSARSTCGCNRDCGTTGVAAQAEAAGLQVVMDRCLKVDYARLSGR